MTQPELSPSRSHGEATFDVVMTIVQLMSKGLDNLAFVPTPLVDPEGPLNHAKCHPRKVSILHKLPTNRTLSVHVGVVYAFVCWVINGSSPIT
jgi:hypothetical protein